MNTATMQPVLKSIDFSPTVTLIPFAIVKKTPEQKGIIFHLAEVENKPPATTALVLYESRLPAIIT
jgi:hypothetical protein